MFKLSYLYQNLFQKFRFEFNFFRKLTNLNIVSIMFYYKRDYPKTKFGKCV